jgi:PKD repeat protein
LKLTNCSACTNRLQFQINDYKISALNAAAVIDSSVRAGFYSFQIPGSISTSYNVNFTSHPFIIDSTQNFAWNFGDSAVSALANPSHIYSHQGIYNVCLTIAYGSGCTSSVCNKIKVGNVNTACHVNITGNTTIYPGDYTTLKALFNPYCANTSYVWSNGATTASITVAPTVTTTYTLMACCSSTSYCDTSVVTVTVESPTQSCISNFVFSDSTSISNLYSLSNVTVTWTDKMGAMYTSNNIAQPKDSYFQIISVEDHSNNELGQRTKKLHVKFKCKVFGSANLQIDNGDAVIAVAYK